jgi:LPPG:FO 2-phospho-L-lactate transferase
LEEVVKLGGPDWFRLGDLDLATHLVRAHLISSGSTLTAATQVLCQHFNVETNVLPMTDEAAPTMIVSDEGVLPFQTWFVARRWQPVVRKIELPEDVRTTAQIVAVLEKADLIIIAPSNPFVSIEPILNVYPIREMIIDLPELVVAVSPIIAGEAVKGPAAKMMQEMGMEVSAASVADHYGDLLDVYIYDQRDESVLERPNLIVKQVDTMMYNRADRRRLARRILQDSLELIYS